MYSYQGGFVVKYIDVDLAAFKSNFVVIIIVHKNHTVMFDYIIS